MSERTTRVQAWGTLAALAIVWGSSYILIKKSLDGLEAWQVGGLRITLTSLAFLPLAVRYCRGLSAKQWGLLTVIGLCGTGLPSFLFPLAQRELSSSLAGALSSLTPLMTVLAGVALFGTRLQGWRLLGVGVGLVGALLLVVGRFGFDPGGAGERAWPVGAIAMAAAATLCYGTSSNIVKRYFPGEDALRVTAGAMAPLGLMGVTILLVGGGLPVGEDAGATVAQLRFAYASVVFLALIGTALASWLFFRLVQLTDPVFASTVSYLVPIVALGWGLADRETVTPLIVAGLALVLAGVYLSKRD